jgi:CRP-like cAMP-binding protein
VRIYERLKAAGLGKDGDVPLPFRQQDLADAIGLSLVHTNKTLKALRSMGLAHWNDGSLQLKKIKALADLAMIDLERPQQRPLM